MNKTHEAKTLTCVFHFFEGIVLEGALSHFKFPGNESPNEIEMSAAARIQGFVIFVTNAKPRDHLKIRITRIGRSTANAEIVK